MDTRIVKEIEEIFLLPMSLWIEPVFNKFVLTAWNAWFNASIYLKDNEKLPIQNIMRAILIANSNVLNSAAAENDQVNQFAEAIKYSTIILTTVPVLCIYPFIQKYFVKGVMIGAVKG